MVLPFVFKFMGTLGTLRGSHDPELTVVFRSLEPEVNLKVGFGKYESSAGENSRLGYFALFIAGTVYRFLGLRIRI